jgi:hypothetical protein
VTGRGLAVQGGLALAGLAIAYGTWQREPERAAGEVIVVDASKSELGSVHFEDDNTTVDVQRGNDAGESGVWLKVQDKTPVPAPKPPAATDKTSTPPPPVPPTKPRPLRVLRGDEAAEKLLAAFAPFRSPRAFGVLDAKKAKELGLDAPKKKLVITARGQTRTFVIGQPSQGSGENYLRDSADGRTYLMPRQLLTDLQGAMYRLVDRKMHSFKITEVNRVVVASGGKSRDFVIKNNKDPNGYKLAPAATPDKPDEMARNWHDKVWRMFPTELLGKGETPTHGQPKVATRIEYFDGAKSAGWLEIGKVDVPPGAAPPPSPNPHGPPPTNTGIELYGRSEHTAGWVRLSNDPTTVTEAEKIVAGS